MKKISLSVFTLALLVTWGLLLHGIVVEHIHPGHSHDESAVGVSDSIFHSNDEKFWLLTLLALAALSLKGVRTLIPRTPFLVRVDRALSETLADPVRVAFSRGRIKNLSYG